jgi:hypothetical protein
MGRFTFGLFGARRPKPHTAAPIADPDVAAQQAATREPAMREYVPGYAQEPPLGLGRFRAHAGGVPDGVRPRPDDAGSFEERVRKSPAGCWMPNDG